MFGSLNSMLTIGGQKTIAVRDCRWRGMSRITDSVSVACSYGATSARSTTNTWTTARSTTARSTATASPYSWRTHDKAREKHNTKRLWHIDLRAIQLLGTRKPTI